MTLGHKEPSVYSVKSHSIFNNRRDLLAPPPWHPRIMPFLLPWGPNCLLIVALTPFARRTIVQRLSGMIDSRSPIALDEFPGGQLIHMAPLGRTRGKGKPGLVSSALGPPQPIQKEDSPCLMCGCTGTKDHVHSGKQDQACEVKGVFLKRPDTSVCQNLTTPALAHRKASKTRSLVRGLHPHLTRPA